MIKKFLSLVLVSLFTFTTAFTAVVKAEEDQFQITKIQKELRLWYDEEAPYGNENISASGSNTADDGWEKWSLPLGNGYIGANVFGRTDIERVQITEATLANSLNGGGLNNFCELYLSFGHKFDDVINYSRDLVLNTAIANTSYTYNGVNYKREYFTDYPDKVMVIRLTADKENSLSFTLNATIPYIAEGRKTGTVTADAQEAVVTISGRMEDCGVNYEGQFKIINTDGVLSSGADENGNGTLMLTNATEAVIIIAADTNYKLEGTVFTQSGSNKLTDYNPHDDVTAVLNNAVAKGYSVLRENHIQDYTEYFGRVTFDLGAEIPDVTTDVLLNNYKNGDYNKYLEELYFQYGRYLLIASSREGGMPAGLQGIWNRYDTPPWNSGYWHNINVQMNYWPAFSTNLSEMCAYTDFFDAANEAAKKNADTYIKNNFPNAYKTNGENGWLIGTATGPFNIGTISTTGYTGPGVVGLTAKMLWDYYDFTRDDTVLSNIAYPALLSAAEFGTKVVTESDGKYLALYSGSPEQYHNGEIYTTVGAAFDQQMIYEMYNDLLKSGEILGKSGSDEVYSDVYKQIDKLDPVLIGDSGQVKEFREENMYGEIGEPDHRHISQLAGLYPGTMINDNTPAWLDGARVTLENRGDKATGWGVAHRLNLWARTKDGERTYKLYKQLLSANTLTNLWDTHPPFQIDGNLGGTAGVSEMLQQSHDGYITPLAAIPAEWNRGSYNGLVARGNFVTAASWQNGTLTAMEIISNDGGECKIKYPNIKNAAITKSDGSKAVTKTYNNDIVGITTTAGETYYLSGFEAVTVPDSPAGISSAYAVDLKSALLSWESVDNAVSYNVYKAVENQSDYTLVSNVKTNSFEYAVPENEINARITWAVTAVDSTGRESTRAISYTDAPVKMNAQSVISTHVDGTTQIAVIPEGNAGEYAKSYTLYRVETKAVSGAAYDRKVYTALKNSEYPIFYIDNYDENAEYAVGINDGQGSDSKTTVQTGSMPDKYGIYCQIIKLKAIDASKLSDDEKVIVNNAVSMGEQALRDVNATESEIQNVLNNLDTAIESLGSIVISTSFTAKQNINTSNICIKGTVTGKYDLPFVSVMIEDKDGNLCYVNQFPIADDGKYICKFKFKNENDISDYKLTVNAAANSEAELTVISATAASEIEVLDFNFTGTGGRKIMDSTNAAYANVLFANYFGDNGTGTIFLAYYNENNALIGFEKKEISCGFDDIEFSAELSSQRDKEVSYAKAFVWRSVTDMIPMTEALILTKK